MLACSLLWGPPVGEESWAVRRVGELWSQNTGYLLGPGHCRGRIIQGFQTHARSVVARARWATSAGGAAVTLPVGSRISDPGGWLARSGGGKMPGWEGLQPRGGLRPAAGSGSTTRSFLECRYLSHSFVESPEMVKCYTRRRGDRRRWPGGGGAPRLLRGPQPRAPVSVHPIGTLALATVEGEVRDNAFTIRTDQPGVTVSWQVTGVRQDPWAEANRIAGFLVKPEGSEHASSSCGSADCVLPVHACDPRGARRGGEHLVDAHCA